MFQKKLLIVCGLLFGCLNAEMLWDDDDFLLDLGDGPVSRTCSNANLIVPPLFECEVIDILKNDFFLKTSDLNRRSILDEPLFQAAFRQDDRLSISMSFFFDKTDRCYFTSSSSNISSYLALKNSPFVESIENSFETILSSECGDFFIDTLGIPRTVFNTDVAALFALFSGGTVEERRSGFLCEVYKNVGLWNLGLKIPVLWWERNFFLSQPELDAINSAGLISSQQSPNDALEYQSDHLISDKVGLGDSRLFAAYQFLDKNDATINIGVQVTLPSALPVQKGVIGSEFRECLKNPSLDLCDILNLGLNPGALKRRISQDLSNFGNEFIDRLAAILNDTSLGNKGHWGLGIFLEPAFNFNDTLSWRTHLSVEQLLPGCELRFFIKKFNEEEFDSHDYTSSDETIAEDNLRFLNQRIIDMFFPDPKGIEVLPGLIVFCSNYLTYKLSPTYSFMLGLDYWHQEQEEFFISNKSNDFMEYNVNKARNPSAQQLKILGAASYKHGNKDNGWILSLKGDTTIFSTGIGKTYTVVGSLNRTW
jgi:hypothetical protein